MPPGEAVADVDGVEGGTGSRSIFSPHLLRWMGRWTQHSGCRGGLRRSLLHSQLQLLLKFRSLSYPLPWLLGAQRGLQRVQPKPSALPLMPLASQLRQLRFFARSLLRSSNKLKMGLGCSNRSMPDSSRSSKIGSQCLCIRLTVRMKTVSSLQNRAN